MNFIPFLLASTLIAIPFKVENNTIDSVTYNVYQVADDIGMAHARMHPCDIGETSYLIPGTNWAQEEVPAINNSEASYFRYVVNAPSAGTYHFAYTLVGSNYLLRNYVNNDAYTDTTVTAGWGALTTEVMEFNLNAGNNVIITQVNNWGAVKEIGIENSLTLVKHDESDGRYYFSNHKNVVSHLYYSDGDMFNNSVIPSVGPLDYDSNSDYSSLNTLTLTNNSDTKSLNLTYLTKGLSGSTADIAISVNDGSYFNVSLPSSNDVYNVYNISNSILSAGGYDFTASASNKISIKPVDGFDKVVILDSIQLSSQSSSEETFIDVSIDEIKSKSYVMGRNEEVSDAIRLDWSASSVQLNFDGEGSVYILTNSTGGARLTVEIDNEKQIVAVPNGSGYTKIASNLTNGTHLMRIFKNSEANGSIVEVKGLRVNESISLNDYNPTFDYKFEFYGGSSVCGNQINSDGEEDAYMSFSRIISDEYNATFNSVCASGRGLYAGRNAEEGWAPSKDNQFNKFYKYTSFFRDRETLWDFSSFVPDVLMINLGNNDLGKALMEELNYTVDDFTTELKRWHKEVRGLYSNTEIIYLYGLFENRDYESEYRSAIEELQNDGDSKVTFLYVPYLGQGKGSHPCYLEHELLARYLSEIVSSKLGIEDPLGLTRRIEAEEATITGRYTTRTAGNDWERWSNGKYIGNTGPESPINSASEIKTDGSNVKLFSFDVNVEEAGRYAFRVAYSTQASDSTLYYRLGNENNNTYTPLVLKGTDSWATPLTYSEPMYVELTSGYNEFIMTGPSTNGSWANFDYIQYYKVQDDGKCYISTPYSSLYSFEDLPSSVLPGETVNFKVNVSEIASQSIDKMKVFANHVELAVSTGGYYQLANITTDVKIEITGLDRNSWNVIYKDDGVVVKTESWRVGDNVSYSSLPNKHHYRFVGWDSEPPSSMPNHDVTLNAVYVYDESIVVNTTPWALIITLASISGALAIGIAVTLIIVNKKRKEY